MELPPPVDPLEEHIYRVNTILTKGQPTRIPCGVRMFCPKERSCVARDDILDPSLAGFPLQIWQIMAGKAPLNLRAGVDEWWHQHLSPLINHTLLKPAHFSSVQCWKPNSCWSPSPTLFKISSSGVQRNKETELAFRVNKWQANHNIKWSILWKATHSNVRTVYANIRTKTKYTLQSATFLFF